MADKGSGKRIGSWELLKVWFALGAQSFGGGAATISLIRQAVIERHRWVPQTEVDRDWALCQVAPGVNLIAFTILIGQRIAGIRGSFLAIFGLLLPSVGLTILITAGYASIRTEPLVQHALQGIIPATIGVGLYTGFDMARGAFRKAKGEGLYAVIGSLTALVAAPLLVWRHVPVPLALLGVAAFMGAFVGVWSARGRAEAA